MTDAPKSEVHTKFDENLTEIHSVLNGRLDQLQKTIDEIRLTIKDHTDHMRTKMATHFTLAETTLELSDKVKMELENIKASLSGTEPRPMISVNDSGLTVL